MSEIDLRPTQKYADLYRKCSRDYYNRHKESILAKKKEQYALTHPLSAKSKKSEKSENKIDNDKVKKNYYKEVYKPRIQRQRLEHLKEELLTKSVEEILEKFNIYEKKTEQE